MTWKNFTIYIHPDSDKITIHFPEDPQLDKVGGQLLTMLLGKGFTRLEDFIYQRDRADFWVEQCRMLAQKFQKFGANVVEPPNITQDAPNITQDAPNINSAVLPPCLLISPIAA